MANQQEEYKDSYAYNAGGFSGFDNQNFNMANEDSQYVPNFGKDGDSDEESKTIALKDFQPLPGKFISHSQTTNLKLSGTRLNSKSESQSGQSKGTSCTK